MEKVKVESTVVLMRKSPPNLLLIRAFCDVHSRKRASIEGVVY